MKWLDDIGAVFKLFFTIIKIAVEAPLIAVGVIILLLIIYLLPSNLFTKKKSDTLIEQDSPVVSTSVNLKKE